MHGIEAHVAVDIRVSCESEVEKEKGEKASMGDRVVGGEEGEERGGERGKERVAGEEEAAVRERIEEGEGVGENGEETVGGGDGVGGGDRRDTWAGPEQSIWTRGEVDGEGRTGEASGKRSKAEERECGGH